MTSRPAHVVTGFLGSGKTTLLNRLINHPGMGDTAVIINEFGEVGLDHLLVETAFDDAVLMQSGCICCTIRGDLVDALADLDTRCERGELPGFSRVIIETTGLADPAPVLQTLMSEPTLAGRYHLGTVVTTVDALHGVGHLEDFPEPVKQVAVADRILITKTDLASAAQTQAILERVRDINALAELLTVIDGVVEPSALFQANPAPARARPDAASLGRSNGHGHVSSVCFDYDRPVDWAAFKTWINSIASLRGADLFRVKGLVNVVGLDRPVVVHGVQHVFHRPECLARWPDADRRTRIVFFTRGLSASGLRHALDAANDAFATRR